MPDTTSMTVCGPDFYPVGGQVPPVEGSPDEYRMKVLEEYPALLDLLFLNPHVALTLWGLPHLYRSTDIHLSFDVDTECTFKDFDGSVYTSQRLRVAVIRFAPDEIGAARYSEVRNA